MRAGWISVKRAMMQPPEFWVIELSSYQTPRCRRVRGVARRSRSRPTSSPSISTGTAAKRSYIVRQTRRCSPRAEAAHRDPQRRLTATPGGDDIAGQRGALLRRNRGRLASARRCRVSRRACGVRHPSDVPLPGRHNRGNLCASAGRDRGAWASMPKRLAPHTRPRSSRCRTGWQTLGVCDGITYVNDSISTTPHATPRGAGLLPVASRCAAGGRPRPRHRLD